jgi:hypothetical protein
MRTAVLTFAKSGLNFVLGGPGRNRIDQETQSWYGFPANLPDKVALPVALIINFIYSIQENNL